MILNTVLMCRRQIKAWCRGVTCTVFSVHSTVWIFRKLKLVSSCKTRGQRGERGGNVSEEGGNLNAAENLKFPNRK